MKQIYIILFLVSIFAACEKNHPVETTQLSPDTVYHKAEKTDSIHVYTEAKLKKSTVDFLSLCDSLEIWKGGIQGVPQSDSTGVYIMAQCASNKEFDLIVYCERELSLDEATDYSKETIKNDIRDAAYYAFEIPKHKSINLEEGLDTYDYFFPCEVNVYKRFDDGWYLISKNRITSFEQLGRLKLNTIYKK